MLLRYGAEADDVVVDWPADTVDDVVLVVGEGAADGREVVDVGPGWLEVEVDGPETGAVSDPGPAVVDVVLVAAVPVGGVQPTGGTPEPVCPGMRIVPAHPKSEKVASRVTVPPSVNASVERTWRMKPDPSTDTTTLFDV